ncbi:DNA helicase RecQ [Desulfofustis glycolicus]|uniref:DNA helicase RecQ n=1 Tax=Desulfofustis glycolicus DSM 9705 TaxID=1121409 RepID=A0A1M5Y074_9BACT|nr:DNA helicase RecQ [Desulfofustis glycolicus]MCB2218251.1 DNA helicase RecQ [Desulfobulbaceae bacterium]SHI05224.1 ATP-dependent DNA helicase RecQ [Desulfofustis glycolicus DSM 9705]
MEQNIHQTLKSVFGYDQFRSAQQEIIERLLAGRDCFVLMPTGGGKSLCYQLPALHRDGVGLVVSPLISLMKDQVDALVANGVQAAFYNSSLSGVQARRVLAELHAGQLDLLYVAPERLMSDDFLARLADIPVALIAIDEAHCISQWGHDFRPEYRKLGGLRQHFPQVPIVALTATAEPHTRRDIIERLQLQEAQSFITGYDRPNIRYTVLEKQKPFSQLRTFLAGRPDEAGIVYCLSRKRVDKLCQQLVDAGFAAAPYHAGLTDQQRREAQERFLYDEVRIIVATVAFGMGIDKSNIRFVVHYDIPKNIESFYQETGRSGRDGLPAEALLLFGYGDIQVARGLIEKTMNPEYRRIELHKLNAMIGFAEALGCRRRVLLGYFGEQPDRDCGNCDICLNPPEMIDITEDSRKALSCVYRVGQRFGAGHVIAVLRGSSGERIVRLGHDRLSTYGIGADLSQDYWGSIIRHLVHRGYLSQDVGDYSVLRLTEASWPLLRGEQRLEMARPRIRAEQVGRKTKAARLPDGVVADEQLFDRLRRLRKELADRSGVPPFVIFHDRTLMEMAGRQPLTEEELLSIGGVGEAKCRRYGSDFLEVIETYRGEDH